MRYSVSDLENQAQYLTAIVDRITDIERALARLDINGAINWGDGFPTYDPRYVNVAGDTMTGTLYLNSPAGLAQRIVSANDTGYIDWFLADGSTRIGYLQHNGVGSSTLRRDLAGDLSLQADSGTVWLRAPNGHVRSNAQLFVEATDIVLGASVSNNSLRIHYPGSGDIYYIDYDTGVGADHIFFRPNGTNPPIMDLANSFVSFGRANHNSGWANNAGTFIQGAGAAIGRIWTTTEGSSGPCFRANLIPPGAADNARFVDFTRAGTTCGWIDLVGTTGVGFISASDGRFKTDVTDLDDDESLERIRQLRPVSYRWKCDDEGNACEDGTPTGETQRGFIAQEVHEVAPWAVSQPVDLPVTDEDGNEGEPESGTWGLDYGKLTPDITAAVQALDRKVTAQQQIIDQQQQQIDALTAKVDALVG